MKRAPAAYSDATWHDEGKYEGYNDEAEHSVGESSWATDDDDWSSDDNSGCLLDGVWLKVSNGNVLYCLLHLDHASFGSPLIGKLWCSEQQFGIQQLLPTLAATNHEQQWLRPNGYHFVSDYVVLSFTSQQC